MTGTTTDDIHDALTLDPYTFTLINLLLAVQLLAALVYGVTFDVRISTLRELLIPFVWIDVGVWAILSTKPAIRDTSHTVLGLVIAAGYFLLLLYLAGSIGATTPQILSQTAPSRIGVDWRPLGWGPAVLYAGNRISMVLVPYQVIGYLALSYLIYAAVLDLTRSIGAGLIGLTPCPACAAPLITSVFAGAAGTSSAITLLSAYTYEIATVLFVGSVALLYWRPTVHSIFRRALRAYRMVVQRLQ